MKWTHANTCEHNTTGRVDGFFLSVNSLLFGLLARRVPPPGKRSWSEMDSVIGLLRIRVRRGINLAVRDLGTSDPYLVITMGNQKLKTSVVKKNSNPEWNDELTLSMTDLNVPIHLTLFDKDTFTVDDKMGDAKIDLKPYIASLKMGLQNLPNGCVVSRVQPNKDNCLAEESNIVWEDGRIIQNMILRLRNVESGEVDLRLEWINVPGCKGLEIEGTS